MKTGKLLLLSICFFLSGLAGLMYQTAWAQQFALVFGTSELALATVLSAFMGGLALGAYLAARWVNRIGRPVLVYGILELAIAITALAVPFAIEAAGQLQVALLGGEELLASDSNGVLALFYWASSFAILLLPTALMGATLPLLARHAVRKDAEIGRRISLLYAVNTTGAAIGALATAFLLLPRIGLGATIWVGAGLNMSVFAAAALLSHLDSDRRTETAPSPAFEPERSWILPAILVSGAVSFSWEILWTRLLTPLLGGSVYALATMLASFLVAIALGAALAGPVASSRERARRGFIVAQILIAGLSLAAFLTVDHLPELVRSGTPAPSAGGLLAGTVLAGSLGLGSLLSAMILLPGGLAIGATFPLAVRILARGTDEAAAASARVFAWNTVGAIIGALGTGYFVLPSLRFAGTAALAAAVSLSLAVWAALLVRPRRLLLAGIALTGLMTLGVFRPATPWQMLRYLPMTSRSAPGDVIHYGVGRSTTVLLTQAQEQFRLTTNGLPESSIDSTGYRAGRHVVAHWLAMLPLAVRPGTRSLLTIGLGAGVTVEDLPDSIEAIHVVELEPEVIRANQAVATYRRRDPLADPRLSLHIQDARGALRMTHRRFGAVVSQPSHPWTSGAANLYTRELFELVRQRLEPGGVFVQWMGFQFVDEPLFRSLVATAADVFPYIELYQPRPGAVLIVGSELPMELESTAGQTLASAGEQWRELGVLCSEDLFAARWLDNSNARRFARGAPLITDTRNLLRMRSPRVMQRKTTAVASRGIPEPHQSATAPVGGADLPYLVRRLIRQGDLQRARQLAERLDEPVAQRTARAQIDLAAGRRHLAERGLRQALRLDSTHREARALWWKLNRGTGSLSELRLAGGMDGSPSAMISSAWHLDIAGDWRGNRRLDSRLAAVDPRHPLFDTATRLRVRWRLESGRSESVEEALDILVPLLAPLPHPNDLLLYARVGAALGESRIALAALNELWSHVPGSAARIELSRKAMNLLNSLPEEGETQAWREQLLGFAERDLSLSFQTPMPRRGLR